MTSSTVIFEMSLRAVIGEAIFSDVRKIPIGFEIASAKKPRNDNPKTWLSMLHSLRSSFARTFLAVGDVGEGLYYRLSAISKNQTLPAMRDPHGWGGSGY
jgi:hypothetical protein